MAHFVTTRYFLFVCYRAPLPKMYDYAVSLTQSLKLQWAKSRFWSNQDQKQQLEEPKPYAAIHNHMIWFNKETSQVLWTYGKWISNTSVTTYQPDPVRAVSAIPKLFVGLKSMFLLPTAETSSFTTSIYIHLISHERQTAPKSGNYTDKILQRIVILNKQINKKQQQKSTF